MSDEETTQVEQEEQIDPEIMEMIKTKRGDEPEEPEAQETQEQPQETQEVQETQEEASVSEFYAKLVEKDKKIFQLEKALKAQQQSSPDVDLRELAKEEGGAFKVLTELGLSPESFIDAWVGNDREEDKTPTVEDPRVDRLEKELAEFKKREVEQAQAAEYHAQMAFVDDVIKKSDRWEAIGALKEEGSYQYVIQVAQQAFNETGQVPDMELLLDHVESELEEHAEQKAGRYLGINKIKSKFVPAEEKVVQKEERKPVTLNSNLTTEPEPLDDSVEAARERAWRLAQELKD